MKKIFLFLFVIESTLINACSNNEALRQSTYSVPNFSIELEAINSSNLPPLHSFAYAELRLQNHDYLLIVGGNSAGVHQFDNTVGYNQKIYLLDIHNNKVIAMLNLSRLRNKLVKRHLATVNSEFIVKDNYLYYIGGLNAANINNPYLITYPMITKIDLKGLVNNMLNNKRDNYDDYFKNYSNPNLQLTGGMIARIKNNYYLAYGQNFNMIYSQHIDGSYSPYVYKLQINNQSEKSPITITNKESNVQLARRRDSNMWAATTKGGIHSQLMISGGPFQPINQDGMPLLYETPILIDTESQQLSISTPGGLQQQFNQYAATQISMYSQHTHENYLLTLGGITDHFLNVKMNKIEYQPNPPRFSNLISILIGANTNWREYYSNIQFLPIGRFCSQCEQIPLYSGTNSIFIIDSKVPLYADNGQINYDQLLELHSAESRILLGTMYGGLVSYTNVVDLDGNIPNSSASNNAYLVYLHRGVIPWVDNNIQKKN